MKRHRILDTAIRSAMLIIILASPARLLAQSDAGTDPSNELLFVTSDIQNEPTPFGHLATPYEICAIFEHPIFDLTDKKEFYKTKDAFVKNYKFLDQWIVNRSIKYGLMTNGYGYEKLRLQNGENFSKAHFNYVTCLSSIYDRSPEKYGKISKLVTLFDSSYSFKEDTQCYMRRYSESESMDDDGNFIKERKVDTNLWEPCIGDWDGNFETEVFKTNFNPAPGEDFAAGPAPNSQFIFALLFKESHNALMNILNKSYTER